MALQGARGKNPHAPAISNETRDSLQARSRKIGWRSCIRLMLSRYHNSMQDFGQKILTLKFESILAARKVPMIPV